MSDLTTTVGLIKNYKPYFFGDYSFNVSTLPPSDATEISLSYVLENYGLDSAIWLLRLFDYKEYCPFCANVAESVLHIFEKEFPEDGRPREAIEGIRKYGRGEITLAELEYINVTAHDTIVNLATIGTSIALAARAAYAACVIDANYTNYTVIAHNVVAYTIGAVRYANSGKDQEKEVERLLVNFINN